MSYTDEQRRSLWEQFAQVHGESQEAYDNAIRFIAAAGVGITASLATALHDIGCAGIAAVALFLTALTLNLASYLTAQADMHARTAALRKKDDLGVERNGWTTATTTLNALAGGAVVIGGLLLAVFIGTAT